MLTSELETYARLCAGACQPVALGAKQTELLIKRMAKSDKPEQVLQEKLSAHYEYWSSRFGLLDAKPFAMERDWLFYAEWADNILHITFSNQPKLTITNCNIKTTLLALAKKHNASITLQDLPAEGSLDVYSNARPQHDWVYWLLAMSAQSSAKHARKLMREYRAGNSPANSLAELEALVING